MAPKIIQLPTVVWLALAAALLCSSCDKRDDNKITVYRIPKEAPPAVQPVAMTSAGGPTGVHWAAPAGWEEQPASGFRKGSFLARGADGKTADVSVISFPEAAGGLLANVNRWREQLKLAPIADESQAGSSLAVEGREIVFVDLVSSGPVSPDGVKSRILGGILPLAGETWFFKMIGPDEVVAAQREAFKEFLQSVRVSGEPAASLPMTANIGAGASMDAPTPRAIEPSQGGPLQFTLPANWQEKPLTPMRVASFNATAANGKAVDVSVVSLGGMAGGDLANVNRWRDQVKLGPIDQGALEQSAEHIKANGRDFLVVDLVSEGAIGQTGEKQRIIAAILDENDHSWFIKMVGEDAAVAAQKGAFADFLRSLKLP